MNIIITKMATPALQLVLVEDDDSSVDSDSVIPSYFLLHSFPLVGFRIC